MYYIIDGHEFEDEVQSMLQLFYPNVAFKREYEIKNYDTCVVSSIDDKFCYAVVCENGKEVARNQIKKESLDIRELKRYVKTSLYYAFRQLIKTEMPWGILTGVRPAKRVFEMWNDGFSDSEIARVLKEKFLVSEEKIMLTLSVAHSEKNIVKDNNENKVGLYVGIPFCPTRCLYCSFTSYPIFKYKNKVDTYLKCLEKEVRFLGERISRYELESIYIGGGTPTSLNEEQLEFLMKIISENFKRPLEYTVEAGRPDTITREKLKILKKYNVSRISVNPQTMNNKTLELIGREHTVEDFLNVFYMAKEEGHEHINTDLILGLPSETEKEVLKTFEEISKLSPESVTVHTLAVKRASRLKETFKEYKMTEFETMNNMIDISFQYAKKMNMYPYYMYKQKNMVGNFENVGYCKKNCESIYNIQIMEEKQSIFAVGAGASTKLYTPSENRVERIFNVKSVDDYIARIDEMIDRKAGIIK